MDSLAPFELQQMHSADLKLFEKADILVTETVDSAIFGESIIPTLIDAYERLIKCDAIVIPSKVNVLLVFKAIFRRLCILWHWSL